MYVQRVLFPALTVLLLLTAKMPFAEERTFSTPSLQLLAMQFEPVRALRPGGPPSSYTAEQKYNFYLGQTYAALQLCGYYSLANEFRALQTDASAFNRGEGTLAGADSMRNCQAVKRSADNFLSKVRPPRKVQPPKKENPPSEGGKIETFQPPVEMKAKEFSKLYSADGFYADGYMARGDRVNLLQKRGSWCRIEIRATSGWVECGLLIPTN